MEILQLEDHECGLALKLKVGELIKRLKKLPNENKFQGERLTDSLKEIWKVAFDPRDDNPKEFKAKLSDMGLETISLRDTEKVDKKALSYVRMCLLKPASITVPIPYFDPFQESFKEKFRMWKFQINYPWNRKTQNLIFFAVVAEAYLDALVMLFVRAPRLHWFYFSSDWFAMTFRPEIYLTVFYYMVRLWVNQWQLDNFAAKGEIRITSFLEQVQSGEGWFSKAAWKHLLVFKGPLGTGCAIHFGGRIIVFLLAMMPFIPVSLVTAMGWAGLGCLSAYIWHRAIDRWEPQADNRKVKFVLGWAAVLCLIAVLWAFGYFWFPAPWYWLEVVFILAWFLVAFLAAHFCCDASLSDTSNPASQPFLSTAGSTDTQNPERGDENTVGTTDFLDQLRKDRQLVHKFKMCAAFIKRIKDYPYLIVYLVMYLVLCITWIFMVGAGSQHVFPVSAETYLCPKSQLKIFSTGTDAMGTTVIVLVLFAFFVASGLTILTKLYGDKLNFCGWEGTEIWFYRLWQYTSRDVNFIVHDSQYLDSYKIREAEAKLEEPGCRSQDL
jgi:hypothetical protein